MGPFHEIQNVWKRGKRRIEITPRAIRNRILFKRSKGKDRILIFSDPRGGSTWLASVLEELPGSYLFFEPFNERNHPEISALGSYRYQYIPEGEKWRKMERFFKELLAPGFLSYSFVQDSGFEKADHYIYKFCFAKFLLPWLVEKFSVFPILLIRHPCAVVSSQLAHPKWEGWSPSSFPYPDGPYSEYFKRYKDKLDGLKRPEEYIAARWAMGMERTLSHKYNDQKWATVAYEDLYLNPEASLKRLGERLEFKVTQNMVEAVREPSLTTLRSKKEKRFGHYDQLYSWKNKLTPEQERRVMNVIEDFGVQAYGGHPLPDPEVVYRDEGMKRINKENRATFDEKMKGMNP